MNPKYAICLKGGPYYLRDETGAAWVYKGSMPRPPAIPYEHGIYQMEPCLVHDPSGPYVIVAEGNSVHVVADGRENKAKLQRMPGYMFTDAHVVVMEDCYLPDGVKFGDRLSLSARWVKMAPDLGEDLT